MNTTVQSLQRRLVALGSPDERATASRPERRRVHRGAVGIRMVVMQRSSSRNVCVPGARQRRITMRPAERVKIIEWIAAFASVALVGVLMVTTLLLPRVHTMPENF